MTDPTQEQRGVSDRSTPWTQVSHLPGYEWRLNKNGHRETRPIEKVEQGASMGAELRTINSDAEYLARAEKFMANASKMNNSPIPYMIAAAFKNEDRAASAEAESRKLSTRIGEIQLAEKVEVEELARVRGLLKEYRNFSWHSSCNEHSLEGDRRCLTCIKTDALLAPKPLDTNEGGE